jgi:hypothetical protein
VERLKLVSGDFIAMAEADMTINKITIKKMGE